MATVSPTLKPTVFLAFSKVEEGRSGAKDRKRVASPKGEGGPEGAVPVRGRRSGVISKLCPVLANPILAKPFLASPFGQSIFAQS